jgi:hypothetical protein
MPEEICDREETLVLTMPPDHPLLKIVDRVSALETHLTTLEAKLDLALKLINTIGAMQQDVWNIVMAAQQQVAQQKIIVPGRP